jgi:hypothetical protein
MPRMKHMHTDMWLDRDDDGIVRKVGDDGLKDVDVLRLAGSYVGRQCMGGTGRGRGTYRDEPESEAVDV